jgi:3-phosphoshikimate 1-carboxyvinyltransferase
MPSQKSHGKNGARSTAATPLWPAPTSQGPLAATISLAGSKSVTNRALVLAALAQAPSTLYKPLYSRDSELMIGALRALGLGVDQQPESISISPRPMKGPASIDVGNAGTVMRFLPPLAALAEGEISFDGDPRSHERPLKPVIQALEELGIAVDHGGRYALPLIIHGTGEIAGGEISIDASQSSQFLSSLLLVAPRMKNGLTIHHVGKSLPSMPHIDMTIAMLKERGVKVERPRENTWRVGAGSVQEMRTLIEPDLSNAAPFLGAAMIAGGSVTIKDWPKSTTQPGDQLREIFSTMGAEFSKKRGNTSQAEDLTITGTGSIHGIDIDLHDVGELTPSIATVALFANSPSHLRGIGHLRLHETDRLEALAREFNNLGGNVIAHEDSLEIFPSPLHGGTFHTYEDHRLATAAAMIGLKVPNIVVENIETTSKTFPDFPGLWRHMNNQVQVQL